jgi:hypothetical protein
MTLLMVATGRPTAVNWSAPSGRMTASFSPRMLASAVPSGSVN